MNKFTLALLAVGLSFSSCKKDEDNGTSQEQIQSTLKSDAKTTYAEIVSANYEDALEDAEALETVINTFVTSPSEANLKAAQEAWLQARESYGTTEAFRFASGPIDDEDGPEGLLNAWPLDESYIDYVYNPANDEILEGGIVNNTTDFPTISKSVLEGLNEVGGETNISVGYHAIEFLLWGQDLTDEEDKLPGQRKYTDYVTDGSGTNSNQARRGEYLNAAASLLIDHLTLMVDEWSTDGNNYRSTFLALDNDEALKNVFTGIGILAKAELAGERIFVAYENKDQEDEHSCFADNTHRDIILNFEGCRNVYNGSYTRTDGTVVSGTGLDDVVTSYDAETSGTVAAQLVISETAVNEIPNPFDLAVKTSNAKVLASVTALRALGDDFADAASAIGITISIDE